MLIAICVILFAILMSGLMDRAQGGVQFTKYPPAQKAIEWTAGAWPLLAAGLHPIGDLLVFWLCVVAIHAGRNRAGWSVVGEMLGTGERKPELWERALLLATKDQTRIPSSMALAGRCLLWGAIAALPAFLLLHWILAAKLVIAYTVGTYAGVALGVTQFRQKSEPLLPAAVANWLGVPRNHWAGAWGEFYRGCFVAALLAAMRIV